jgi:4-hydroxybenzoate polyprenyltransferase
VSFLKKIINLILYGNFWIALGAVALTFQTQLVLKGDFQLDNITWFVFFATFLLYALHRIVGILGLKDFLNIDRYFVINKFRQHIIYYAIFATLGALYFFIRLTWQVQLALIIPCLLSISYVLPFFGKKRRLRDFNQIKIYLIAGVWAFVTVVLPFIDSGQTLSFTIISMIVERGIFVFAITLPFDIRDLEVDDHGAVKTIPAVIGIKKTKQLAYATLGLAFALALSNYFLGLYDLKILIGLAISYLSTIWLVSFSAKERHDYFYSGLMDGTMILQFLMVIGLYYYF